MMVKFHNMKFQLINLTMLYEFITCEIENKELPLITSCLFLSSGDRLLKASGGTDSVTSGGSASSSESLFQVDDLFAGHVGLPEVEKLDGTETVVFSQLPLLLQPTTSNELLGLSKLLLAKTTLCY